ncbi:MAG: hypothetical protein ABSE82_15630, partial [Nitrososphaerales archaeon]
QRYSTHHPIPKMASRRDVAAEQQLHKVHTRNVVMFRSPIWLDSSPSENSLSRHTYAKSPSTQPRRDRKTRL